MVQQLHNSYGISVLSGDNNHAARQLRKMMGHNVALLFEQKPADKLAYIQQLQAKGEKVMMIGDGLNDAGALKQSDIGISIAEDNNNFTPASDGIMKADKLPMLSGFIQLCKANKRIILLSFILSLIYNIIGLYFAVQGILSPLIAAILMPSSSVSIIIITYGCSEWFGKKLSQQGIQQIPDKNHVPD